MLGVDVPGYTCELLSILIALLLHLANSAIIKCNCQSVSDGVECIREYGLSIQVQQFRYAVHQYFGKQLAQLLPGTGGSQGLEEFAGQPPILLLSPGYEGRPADRLRERQLIEQARMRQTEEDKRRDQEMKTRLGELESTLQRRLQESEQRFAAARQQFEDQLKNEREKRAQVEEKAVREAIGLRGEVEQLKHHQSIAGGPGQLNVVQSATSARFVDSGPTASPEVQQLINHYLGRVLDGYEPQSENQPKENKPTGPPQPIPEKIDPRYEDPLKYCDADSKAVLSGIMGSAGPSAARLAHGGANSKLTSPGYVVINPSLNTDNQNFTQRFRAACEHAEKHLYGKTLDAAALADMSEYDRQAAVSRVLAMVCSNN